MVIRFLKMGQISAERTGPLPGFYRFSASFLERVHGDSVFAIWPNSRENYRPLPRFFRSVASFFAAGPWRFSFRKLNCILAESALNLG